MTTIGEKVVPFTNISAQAKIGIVQYHVVLLLYLHASSTCDKWWVVKAVRLAVTDVFNVSIFGNKSNILMKAVRVFFINAGAGNDHFSLIAV